MTIKERKQDLPKIFWIFGLRVVLATLFLVGLRVIQKYLDGIAGSLAHGFILKLCVMLPLAIAFFIIILGGFEKAKKEAVEYWQELQADKKGFLLSLVFLVIIGLVISLFIGVIAESINIHGNNGMILTNAILFGCLTIPTLYAYIKLDRNGGFLMQLLGIGMYCFTMFIVDIWEGISFPITIVATIWYAIIGFAILAKRKGFATGIALFFHAVISCNLLCACEKYNIAGFTFVTEPATGLNETMGLLFALLVGSMAFVAYYFYEYAYAYSLPMKEVVQKTKFAYQRTWGGKPLVIAELLPLLKKNRENIKIWSDAVITHEDYARSRTMSCNESYYGVHGFQNGAWHRFDDGLLVHAETTSNREGRFRLNYHWPADRFLIKVIEKEKLYVGIFAVVATLEEVQSYGKAYNFHAPPNVLSRWTKAPLNFRCQCALLYDVSTGEEAYIRYDVIDHPDGFRRNLRGFSGGITLD